MQAQDDISKLAEKVAALHAALDALRPTYDYSVPYIFGGGIVKTYTMSSPYDTPCEYAVLTASFLGVGDCGLSSMGDPNGFIGNYPALDKVGLYGIQHFVSAASMLTITPALAWLPLQANGTLYLAVNASGNETYVTVQFRRRINPSGVPSAGF